MTPVSNKEALRISLIFPLISTDDLFNEKIRSKLYSIFTISQFDHWLSEDEALQCVLSYAASGDLVDIPEAYFEVEKNYLNLFLEIRQRCEIYNFVEKDKESGAFFQFDSAEDFLDVCKKSLREEAFFRLCIPEWRLTISGSHDLETIVHYTNKSFLDTLLKLVEQNNLHVIWPSGETSQETPGTQGSD